MDMVEAVRGFFKKYNIDLGFVPRSPNNPGNRAFLDIVAEEFQRIYDAGKADDAELRATIKRVSDLGVSQEKIADAVFAEEVPC